MSTDTKPTEDVVTWDGLSDEQGPIPCFPPFRFDQSGRMIPMSPEQREVRHRGARRALAAIHDLPGDDPPEITAEFPRGMGNNRPPGKQIFEGVGLY